MGRALSRFEPLVRRSRLRLLRMHFESGVGHIGGNGSNQWYHVAQMATFVFCGPAGGTNDADCQNHSPAINDGAYINGNNKNICDTGNGATSCLAGKFTILSQSGEVSAAPPPNPGTADVGVQLIH